MIGRWVEGSPGELNDRCWKEVWNGIRGRNFGKFKEENLIRFNRGRFFILCEIKYVFLKNF